MAVLRVILLAIVIGGCGLDPFSEGPGGADNLPTSGSGPYARFESDDNTPADEPFVVFDNSADLSDPSVLTGGLGLRIWMTRTPTNTTDSQVFYVEVASPHDVPPNPPSLALAADQAWEGGRVAAPSVIDLGGGHLAMFYEGGATSPQIGRADSQDNGATWTKQPQPVLADAGVPSAAFLGDHYELYATRTGSPDIWRAVSADGIAGFAFDAAPIMSPRPGLAKAFDADSLTDPDVFVERETTGTQHWTLFAVGFASAPSDAGTGNPSIGAMGSFDGVHWERYGAATPQLSQPATGPAAILSPGHGLLLYSEIKRGLRAIAAAHNP